MSGLRLRLFKHLEGFRAFGFRVVGLIEGEPQVHGFGHTRRPLAGLEYPPAICWALVCFSLVYVNIIEKT